jgi:glycosyltransferase involved in cell wall biosynthesis
LQLENFPACTSSLTLDIVTPSYMQGRFLETTIRSVLDQPYAALHYWVRDGGSTDDSRAIIQKYHTRLRGWISEPDGGQAAAINQGLRLGQGDIVHWLNSDDLLMPGAVPYVMNYFSRHPKVDAVYGHRVLIDQNDQEVARWVTPPFPWSHIEWMDYVPQETLFVRRSLWEKLQGLDESFQYAMDWDLILRMKAIGARIVRLPYFLGCFRNHEEQKTTRWIETVGREESLRLFQRSHGSEPTPEEMQTRHQQMLFTSLSYYYLLKRGIRL